MNPGHARQVNRISRREMALHKRIVWIIAVFLPLAAAAQRLPFGVTPQHYALTFAPDLEKAAFSGDETIDVEVNKVTNAIVLNAIDLEFEEATVIQDGKPQSAKWSFAPDLQQATLTVAQELQPGAASIHIKFTGVLNDKLRGFYLAGTE